MHLNELKALHVSEVLKQAEALEIENVGRMRKQELMFAIIKKRAKAGEQVFADGVLEILPDGFGFLRSPDTSFTASTDSRRIRFMSSAFRMIITRVGATARTVADRRPSSTRPISPKWLPVSSVATGASPL